MKNCLILVGPDKWCQNHIKNIHEHHESCLLYDKFPRQNNTIKERAYEMINEGGFQTFIYVSKAWRGRGTIDYVASTPPGKGKQVGWKTPRQNQFYLHKELTEYFSHLKVDNTMKPIKSPCILPKWDYYDFKDSRNPFVIDNVKEFMKNHSPRFYNVAIKINDLNKIEPMKLDQFEMFDGRTITDAHLLSSFIIARLKISKPHSTIR